MNNIKVIKEITVARDNHRGKYKKGDLLKICLVPSAINKEKFLVWTLDENNEMVNRLLHGPWCLQTAKKHAKDFANFLQGN